MKKNQIIEFEPKERILEKAKKYVDSLEIFFEEGDHADLRLHANFAVGQEGNFQAAIPLIERLYDSDIQVQQTAVNALCNLRDDRILNLLLERLEHGPLEQKRCILFNLWRFYSKQEEVTNIYLKYLEHEDPDLRFDALACLKPVTEAREHLEVEGLTFPKKLWY